MQSSFSGLHGLQRFSNFVGRQKDKLDRSSSTMRQSLLGAKVSRTVEAPPRPSIPLVVLVAKTMNQAMEPTSGSSTLIKPIDRFTAGQRKDWFLWSNQLCKQLSLPTVCNELQVYLFEYLSARISKDSSTQHNLAASLVIACKELMSSPVNFTAGRIVKQLGWYRSDIEMIIQLVEELEFYILPKFRLAGILNWTPLTSQLKDVEALMPSKTDQIPLLRFLVQLRLILFELLWLPNRVQFLVCLVVTELILSSQLELSWQIILSLGKDRLLSDREHALVRHHSHCLFDAVQQLNWTTNDQWPCRDFASFSQGLPGTSTTSCLAKLASLQPLYDHIQPFTSSSIWLLAPSVILE